MSGDRSGRRSGRRPGRRPAKVNVKDRLERSRQSARECRARKKLRYQYLEDLVQSREQAIFSLREELEVYKQWCIEVDNGKISPEFRAKLHEDEPEIDQLTLQPKNTKKVTPKWTKTTIAESVSNMSARKNPVEYVASAARSVSSSPEDVFQKPTSHYTQPEYSVKKAQLISLRQSSGSSDSSDPVDLSNNLQNPASFSSTRTALDKITCSSTIDKSNYFDMKTHKQVRFTGSDSIPFIKKEVPELDVSNLPVVLGEAKPDIVNWRNTALGKRSSLPQLQKYISDAATSYEREQSAKREFNQMKRKDSVELKVGNEFRTLNLMQETYSSNQSPGSARNSPFQTVPDVTSGTSTASVSNCMHQPTVTISDIPISNFSAMDNSMLTTLSSTLPVTQPFFTLESTSSADFSSFFSNAHTPYMNPITVTAGTTTSTQQTTNIRGNMVGNQVTNYTDHDCTVPNDSLLPTVIDDVEL